MNSRSRSGVGLVYAIIFMSVMLLFCSFAVDYGRVQLAKTQLQSAADAAALAGAGELKNGLARSQSAAISIAASNKVDGAGLTLDPANDIEFGRWNAASRQFTPLTGAAQTGANSVRINAKRVAARGTGIDTPFLRMFGRIACDIHSSAVAVASPIQYAAVGIDFIKMSGNATDSYISNGGSVPPYLGSIASNGDITLTGNSMVHGDAHPGVGKNITGADHVSGNTSPLGAPLNFSPINPGSIRTNNDNFRITPMTAVSNGNFSLTNSQSATFPAGNYYFKNFWTTAQSTINITGPVTIYCYGSFSMAGKAVVAGNLPGNLKIVMVTAADGSMPGSLSISGDTALYADIYAPLSPVSVTGGGDIYGSIVGKSLSMSGNGALHYDLSLANNGRIALVK
ncbi:MAG TPA: pilus assembly protein TadG-related protein [Tepidisphaeraceae bacterium]|jgi:hypothetical protein